MKVCYYLATTDLEGGAQSLLDLIKVSLSNNIDVRVILGKKFTPLEKILNKMHVQYIIINHGTDCFNKNLIKLLIKIIVNKIAVYHLIKYLKQEKVDILHSNSVISTIGMEAAKKCNIPYICHIRERIEDGLEIRLINYKKLYSLMNESYCCIAISNFVKERYDKFVKNIIVINDGIDIKAYKENIKRGKINNKVLFVGRICNQKGQHEAIETLNLIVNKFKCDVKLTFVGAIVDKRYYKKINKLIDDYKLNPYVNFLNFTNDLKKLRKENDIALVCSSNEGLGRVLIEAMVSSQLVIAANDGAIKDIVQNNKNGFLYNIGDYNTLAEIIINCINQNNDKIINNGYHFALDNFDNQKQNGNVIKIYNDIINK